MPKRYIPHIFGIGILLAVFTIAGLQGNCGPSGTLRCDEIRVTANTLILNGQLKEGIETANLAKYQPEVYFEANGAKTYINCVKSTATFIKPKLSVQLQCPTKLDELKKDQTLNMRWKVETKQPYSQQALDDYNGWLGKGETSCSQSGNDLVCETVLTAKITGTN